MDLSGTGVPLRDLTGELSEGRRKGTDEDPEPGRAPLEKCSCSRLILSRAAVGVSGMGFRRWTLEGSWSQLSARERCVPVPGAESACGGQGWRAKSRFQLLTDESQEEPCCLERQVQGFVGLEPEAEAGCVSVFGPLHSCSSSLLGGLALS